MAMRKPCVSLTPLQQRRISINKEETSGMHPHISIAELLHVSLFTYALYFVIAFMREVFYLAIIELLFFLGIICWCT
jgi:hypothetical protein